jgi:hypothetical protein
MGPANTCSQAACVPGLVTPQSTAVQPLRIAGSGFFGIFKQPQIDVVQGKWQLHSKPQNAGRNFEGLAQGGQGLAQGKAQRFFARQGRGACGEEGAAAEAEVMEWWTGFCPSGAESCIIDVYVNVNYIDGIVKRSFKTSCRLCAFGNQHGKSIFNQ